MKRPYLVWLVFTACALVGVGVLAWFSGEMMRLDRESAENRRLAAIEENIRLALWRMDSALASVHGLEAARPPEDYESFFRAGAAFSDGLSPLPTGTVMLPSPLLGYTPPFVRLHLQIEPDGTMHSPQAPEASLRPAALAAGLAVERLDENAACFADLRSRIDGAALFAQLPAAPADPLRNLESAARDDREESTVGDLTLRLNRRRVIEEEKLITAPTTPPLPADAPAQAITPVTRAAVQQQQAKSAAEQAERSNLLYASNELNAEVSENRQNYLRQSQRTAPASPSSASSAARQEAPAGPALADEAGRGQAPAGSAPANLTTPAAPTAGDTSMDSDAIPPRVDADAVEFVGPLQSLWIRDELFLARRVARGNQEVLQVVWLDWVELQAWLLSRAADLLPDARLVPVTSENASAPFAAARRLAFLPVQLLPGFVSYEESSVQLPLQINLLAAWTSALIGILALALLLRGTMRLSERRGAFVSAVTHELRTPLTTFRMYTEMLAGGMVVEEAKRRTYVDTLRKEAERLSHLVENVLSYARLERGRAASRIEDTTPGDLLGRMEERLRQRAEQGNLTLRIEFVGPAADLALRTDLTAAEQILFNLVDNAAKYGRPADGRGGTIALTIAPRAAGGIVVRVADQGPGIAAAVRRRLFQPFSKSATEAAHSQPGVGLGLALSRRLARDELQGDLKLERTGPDGTSFLLDLPASPN